jgi:hypothetical protein
MATDKNRDDMEQLIRQSCQVPPPGDQFVRTLAERARRELRSTLAEVPKAGLPRLAEKSTARSWRRAAVVAAGLAAAMLFGVLLWSRQEGVAWAEVAKAVRALPWIHIKAVGGKGESQETWLSFSRNVYAMHYGNTTRYDDYRSGVRHDYDRRQKIVYRLSVNDHTDTDRETLESLFQTILRGNAIPAEGLLGSHLIKQRQRTVNEQGRRWILYELELADPNDKHPNHPGNLVIRVDPEKMLPDLMTFTGGKEKMQVTFDYPAEGPADIYALGVPRDAPVEDRTLPPDLDRIIKIVRQNRRDFGNYLAVAGGDNPSIIHVVRCKGDKFRVDVGIGDIKRVASGADMEKWWQEHGREVLLEGSVLCDGRRIYQHSPVHSETWWKPSIQQQITQGDGRAAAEGVRAGNCDAGEYFVDLLAYPPRFDPQQLASSPLYTVHLDPKGENGPAGSVRVESLRAKQGGPNDRNSFHKEEFWLQPKYGYAVVKHVLSDCPAVDEDPLWKDKQIIHEYDGFRQTPRGAWYPTVSRHRSTSQDQVTYFCLDFTADLPDELFNATWKGDLLMGIHFAPPDGKSESSDLGKIRPPGGVPLFLGGPGRPISVDGIERVRQRLEAVPAKDLEKWVVELERIIDTRLKDGLPSARQACRTDFVIHMSRAFDDVKWNATRAEMLFRRAQSLPTSEARVWKKAFESLLKKEIGQSDTTDYAGGPSWAVPLVLIPFDALYEAERYSAERATKYLARLKQLTVDDISLWQDKLDDDGRTKLDVAMNIILLNYFFDKETFQRDKFRAAIGARK